MQLNNADEATRMCQELRMLKSDGIITEAEAKAAIKKVPFYSDVLGPQNNNAYKRRRSAPGATPH